MTSRLEKERMAMRFDFLKMQAVLLLVFVFCLGSESESQVGVFRDETSLKIMVSVFPLAEFAQEISGDLGKVEMLLPPGAEVHTWQPRPSDIAKLSRTDLFIHIGKNMEPWLSDILQGVSNPELIVLEVAEEFQLGHEEHHHNHGTEASDPHVWLDFEYDILIIKKITDVLCDLAPDHSDFFRSNAEAYQAKLQQLDQRYKMSLASCANRTFIVGGHAAFGYLAKRYDLRQIALYGINPESRPTPRQLKEVVDLAKELKVSAIFVEAFVSDELAKIISREVGLETLELNPGANLTHAQKNAGLSFLDIMENNLENLKDGLSCK